MIPKCCEELNETVRRYKAWRLKVGSSGVVTGELMSS